MNLRNLIRTLLLLFACLAPAARGLQEAADSAPAESMAEAGDQVVLDGQPIPVEELEKKTEPGPDEKRWANYLRDGREAPDGVREREAIAYFVHLREPEMDQARRQIEAAGGRILSADAASSSFLVMLNGEQSKKVEALAEVELVRSVRALDKLGADVDTTRQETSVETAEAGFEEVAMEGDGAPAAMLDLVIVLLPGQPFEDIEKKVSEAGGTIRSRTKFEDSWRLKVTLPSARLEEIASLNAVRSIDLDAVAVTFNDLAGKMIGIPELPVPLTGAGQIIGHADTGIDRGTEDSMLHGDLAGQILRSVAIGRTGDWSDPTGHGTHTAATLVGTGISSGGLYRGIAPGAKLVHHSLLDSQGELQIPADPDNLFGEAYRDGARIHSDSWGTLPAGKTQGNSSYDETARNIDVWAWNQGQPMKMLIVCAAGNYGPEPKTLAGTATAKNCLTVGATGNGDRSQSSLDVHERSSRGPTEAGRRKPDLVAPGAWIASARTRASGTVWQYDLETDSDWQAPTGFLLDNADARSGRRSWHYRQEPGDVVSKLLRSKPFVVPSGLPVYLEFAVKGKLPRGSGIRAVYRKDTDLEWRWRYKPQPVSESRWSTLAFPVPRKLQGIKGILAIEIFSLDPIEEPLEIHIDDLRLTTFSAQGDLSDLSLAPIGDPIDQLYTLKTGTSMATPVVAGAAALLRQFLEENGVAEPGAELLKAMLINGAARTGPPDFDRGWGVLDLRRTLPSASRRVLYWENEVQREKTPSAAAFEVQAGPEPLRVTLVWCDAPSKRLTNNLDMVLHGPGGALHYPFGASQGQPDTLNNVEGVDIVNPEPGSWRVEVEGLPLGEGPQPYVVVVSGAVQATPGSPLATISSD